MLLWRKWHNNPYVIKYKHDFEIVLSFFYFVIFAVHTLIYIKHFKCLLGDCLWLYFDNTAF